MKAHAPQLESNPHSLQLEESLHSNEDPAQPKINKKIIFKKVHVLPSVHCNTIYNSQSVEAI